MAEAHELRDWALSQKVKKWVSLTHVRQNTSITDIRAGFQLIREMLTVAPVRAELTLLISFTQVRSAHVCIRQVERNESILHKQTQREAAEHRAVHTHSSLELPGKLSAQNPRGFPQVIGISLFTSTVTVWKRTACFMPLSSPFRTHPFITNKMINWRSQLG